MDDIQRPDGCAARAIVPSSAAGALARLRSAGWAVGVHNDYRLAGEARTFWLLTHPDGTWVKGEGLTDDEALAEAETCARARGQADVARSRAAFVAGWRASGGDGDVVRADAASLIAFP